MLPYIPHQFLYWNDPYYTLYNQSLVCPCVHELQHSYCLEKKKPTHYIQHILKLDHPGNIFANRALIMTRYLLWHDTSIAFQVRWISKIINWPRVLIIKMLTSHIGNNSHIIPNCYQIYPIYHYFSLSLILSTVLMISKGIMFSCTCIQFQPDHKSSFPWDNWIDLLIVGCLVFSNTKLPVVLTSIKLSSTIFVLLSENGPITSAESIHQKMHWFHSLIIYTEDIFSSNIFRCNF